jgi:peptidoglycan hydrolase CwlO-like protein
MDGDFDKYSHVSNDDLEVELQNHNAAFEALERDFQEVLSEMTGDITLEKFRLEYEKLHRALKRSHEQEKRLVKKCRELNSEILNNQAKIKTALRLSQEDQKTITHLQKEMEKTWKLVYVSQEKESRAKETIGQLKEEMSNLSKLVERGAGLSLNQENTMKDLRQAKEELQRQVEELTSNVSVFQSQLLEQHQQYEDVRNDLEESNRQISELRDRLSNKENEIQRETKRREKTQKELQEARMRIDEVLKKEEALNSDILQGKSMNHDLEKQLQDTKATMDKNLKDYEVLLKKSQKIADDLENQVIRNKQLHGDYVDLEKDLKLSSLENRRLVTENDILERKFDKEHREVIRYQQLLDESKTPLILAHAEIESLKKALSLAHHKETLLLRENDSNLREKELQLKAKQKLDYRVKEEIEHRTEHERTIHSLNEDINLHNIEIQKLKTIIFQLETDRDRISNEVVEQRNSFLQSQEEIRMRDVQISELKKRLNEWENKLKQQQQLYEAVRSDRNHYSKNLLESQDEVAELKKKFKIMGHQIEQLKDEITSKDQALVKGHFDSQRNEKLIQTLQNEVNSKNSLINDNREVIKQLENELKRLTSMIKRLDEDSLVQRKEYDSILNERDILGIQLIRRNDELALLYEKLRIQSSTIKAGEMQYNHRIDDIRMLKMKIKELVRNNALLKAQHNNGQTYKHEILRLQKELLQEKTRVTALSEELENPMNVHRWRKLEGSDPATFELIQKIQSLQRRLISKTEEVVEKGLMIQEKERLYQELKVILSRQPGPEVAEQLAVYQGNIKTKTRQVTSYVFMSLVMSLLTPATAQL